MTRRLLLLFAAALATACTPTPTPTPPGQTTRAIVVAVRDANTLQGIPSATVRLVEQNIVTDGNGAAVFAVPVPQNHTVQVVHDDYETVVATTYLTAGSSEWPITLTPRPPPVAVAPALRIVGPDWFDRDTLYIPRWASALSILTKIDRDRDQTLDAIARSGFNGVRVFAGRLSWTTPVQTPEWARAALPGLIEATRARGLALEVTAVTDSAAGYDWRAHLRAVRDLVAPHSHVVLEGANELSHPTQAADVTAANVASVLAGFGRPWAVGAPLATDEPINGAWPAGQGSYSTVHLDRGRDPWNMTRRVRELYAVVEATRKPALNNEPIGAGDTHEPGRRLDDPAYFAVLGALDAAFRGVGGVHHSSAGLAAVLPSAAQQASADAYVAAHRAVRATLRDRVGQYLNVGHDQSPLAAADFTRVIRIYSFTVGAEGVAVYVGALPGDVGEQWAHGWRPIQESYTMRARDGRALRVVALAR